MPRTDKTTATINDLDPQEWDETVFLLLDEHRFLDTNHIADVTGRSPQTTRRRLNLLKKARYIGHPSAKRDKKKAGKKQKQKKNKDNNKNKKKEKTMRRIRNKRRRSSRRKRKKIKKNNIRKVRRKGKPKWQKKTLSRWRER